VFNIRIAFLAVTLVALAGQAPAQYVRGVNVSQAEWGDPLTGVYGVDYTYPTPPTLDYFAARGLGFVRLQVQWERLQPTLGGPLDLTNLGYLKQVVAAAVAAGGVVSIVPHNQARYSVLLNGVETLCIIDNPCAGTTVTVTAADLADFWVKMSNEFKDEPAVAAYDIMNEPHDMGVASWAQIAQTVVSTVRANGDNKLLMIPGDGWSSAPDWLLYNGLTGFISDPAANYYYEAHEYFDSDGSGTYAETYDQELAANAQLANVGVARLNPFLQWCTVNNVRCYLGEYGIPNDDPRWLTVLDNFLHAIDEAGLPGTYWAAGELWARVNYPLSVQPLGDFAIDREQLPTLLAHLPPASFRTASAAASFGYAVAPGELVAGYGAGLAPETGTATLPLPTKLQDTQVQVTDSSGNVAFAPLVYVSPGQLNYQVPAGTPAGLATAKVLSGGTQVANGILQVSTIAPTLFTANGNGLGVAAAQIQRINPDGTSTYEDVAVYDQGTGQFVASPIAFEGDRLFLLLYGTGFDHASGAGGTTVMVGEAAAQVAYSGPQSQFAGEDQINAELPASLAGAGQVTVSVTVDGTAANAVTITFQ
jgi:endoglucanase